MSSSGKVVGDHLKSMQEATQKGVDGLLKGLKEKLDKKEN